METATTSTFYSVSLFSQNQFTAPEEMARTSVVVITITNVVTMPFPTSTQQSTFSTSIKSSTTVNPVATTLMSTTTVVSTFIPTPVASTAVPATSSAVPSESHTDMDKNAWISLGVLLGILFFGGAFVYWYLRCHNREGRKKREWSQPVMTTLQNGRRVARLPDADTTDSTIRRRSKRFGPSTTEDNRGSALTTWSDLIRRVREDRLESRNPINQPAKAHLGRRHDLESGVFGAEGSPVIGRTDDKKYEDSKSRSSIISSLHDQKTNRDSSISSSHDEAADNIDRSNPYSYINPALVSGPIRQAREQGRNWYGQSQNLPNSLKPSAANSNFARVESNPFQDQADIEMTRLDDNRSIISMYASPAAVRSIEAVRGSNALR